MDALLFDYLCHFCFLIDVRNKPFGAVFPLEIQNRIMWMKWVLEHREKFNSVMAELSALPRCITADWVGWPNRNKRFRTYGNSGWCFPCYTYNCDYHNPVCRWFSLYKEEQLFEATLEEKHDAISCYNSAAYERFVADHTQTYYDLHQFTVTQILIPMLGYIEPRYLQFDWRRLRGTERNFTAIATSVHGLFVAFMHRNNWFTFRNPRTLAEEYHAQQRSVEQKQKENPCKENWDTFLVKTHYFFLLFTQYLKYTTVQCRLICDYIIKLGWVKLCCLEMSFLSLSLLCLGMFFFLFFFLPLIAGVWFPGQPSFYLYTTALSLANVLTKKPPVW